MGWNAIQYNCNPLTYDEELPFEITVRSSNSNCSRYTDSDEDEFLLTITVWAH